MVDADETLSVRRQCDLLGLHRSGLAYQPVGADAEDLAIMRLIDEEYVARPFCGSRRISRALASKGVTANRKRVQRLMRLMGLEAVYAKPNTSEPNAEHRRFPYLLRRVSIVRVNQVFASDITYIPMRQGFAYLVAVMDLYSRRVLSWRLSNTMDPDFCVDAMKEALERFGRPEIFNTDQGAQFTAPAFTDVLLEQGVKVSMDGKGRWMDNVFVERLWRSLKYEEVYLNEYESIADARRGIGAYIEYYNLQRQHQSLGYQTPDQFYRGLKAAA